MKVEDILPKEMFDKGEMLTYEEASYIIQSLVKVSVEEALKVLPTVISHVTAQASHLKKLSEDFYLNHKELGLNKKLVAELVERVESENPGLSYEKILEKTVPLAQERLKSLGNIHSVGKKSLSDLDEELGKI